MKTIHQAFNKKEVSVILSACVITLLSSVQSLQAETLPLPHRGPVPFFIYDLDSNGSISQEEFSTIRSQRLAIKNAPDTTTQNFPMRNIESEPDFAEFDTDKDGQLNQEELAQGQQQQRQKRWEMRQAQMKRMQSQGGSMGQDPGMGMRQPGMNRMQGQGRGMGGARNMPRFEDFDQNNDGLLTPNEFIWGQQRHMKINREMMRQSQGMGMRQGQGMGQGPGMGMRQGQGMGQGPGMGMRQGQGMGQGPGMDMRQGQGRGMNRGQNMPKFEDFDQNKDGFISEQELIEVRSMRISSRIQQGYQMRNAANIPKFQEIDKNSDAKISLEEFSDHQKQHQLDRQKPQ